MLIELDALRHHWYAVAESAAVRAAAPGEGANGSAIGVRLLGDDYVLYRAIDGEVVAAPDRCPHREARLSEGAVGADGCLTCPYHGWRFGARGTCVDVPSSGAGRPVPPAAHLDTVGVRDAYGLIWLCPDEPMGDVPGIRHDDDPTFRRINSGMQTWATSATRMTDNFLDIAHFPWVHTATLGLDAQQRVPSIELEQLDDDFFGYRYEVEVSNESGGTQSNLTTPVVHRRMSTGFHLPFTVRSTIRYETGLEHVILLCSAPIDDVTSHFTFVVWRNDDGSVPADEVIAFDRAIGDEDRAMLERIPGVLPLDAQATASVQADRASVEWRRRLAALCHPH
jgi:phenylpropionate dioxygenase-like ring-hydroxylating dioxygenase large terminal subunit